jgi:hypothetical protein
MADALVHQIELAEEVPDISGLEKGWPWPKKTSCGPRPTTPSSTSKPPEKEPGGSTRRRPGRKL